MTEAKRPDPGRRAREEKQKKHERVQHPSLDSANGPLGTAVHEMASILHSVRILHPGKEMGFKQVYSPTWIHSAKPTPRVWQGAARTAGPGPLLLY